MKPYHPITDATEPGPLTQSFSPLPGAEPGGSPFTPTAVMGSAPPNEPTPTPITFSLPGYSFVRHLGEGGMGTVCLFYEPRHNRNVAIKICRTRGNPNLTDRFLREYETLQNLDHPNVVRVYDYAESGGLLYFSMRFVPTGSLFSQWKAVRSGTQAVVEFVVKVARAVQYVHDRIVLHRDLKPGNILVDENGQPILADFGLAWADDGHPTTTYDGPFGTAAYTAPEINRLGPQTCSERSDIWAIGVILYELLAGVRPFPGERNDPELHRRIRYDAPLPLNDHPTVLPNVDAALECIVLRCLAKVPDGRYATAGELADDLDNWLTGGPLSPSTLPDARAAAADTMPMAGPAKPKSRERRWWWLAAVVGVVAVGLGLAASFWPRKVNLSERLTQPKMSLTFIEETGLPKYEMGRVSGFAGTIGVGHNGRCQLDSTNIVLHELGETDPEFHFRLEAEVAVSTALDRTRVGIYCLRKSHPQSQGEPVSVAYFNAIGLGPRDPADRQQCEYDEAHAAPVRIRIPDGTVRADVTTMFVPFPTQWKKLRPADHLDPSGSPSRSHHLSIEVVNGRIRAFRDGVPFRETTVGDELLLGALRHERVEIDGHPLGRGFGLFVIRGGGQFGNVRVTRLAPD